MPKAVVAVAALVLAVAGPALAQERLQIVAIKPCRLLDTRLVELPAVGLLEPGIVLPVQASDSCGIPFEARALQATITATDTRGPGFLSVLVPSGRTSPAPAPLTSTVNFDRVGQTVANAAFVKLGAFSGGTWNGSFWLLAGVSATHVVVDVSGYYVAAP